MDLGRSYGCFHNISKLCAHDAAWYSFCVRISPSLTKRAGEGWDVRCGPNSTVARRPQLHENPTLQAPTSVLVASLQPCLYAAREDIARFGEDAVTA